MVRRKNTLSKGSFLHRRSHIHTDFSHIAHKRRNTRFNGLWRVHTPPQPLNAHTAAHRANGAGKRGAALRGTFESTKICAKRFQIRDEEKPREQNNSRQTAAARQGRVDAVRRRRGPAGTRSLDAVVSAAVSASALLCLRLYLQLHHRPLLLFRFLAELLRVVVETHASLLLTVFLHLAQQDILLCGVELVAPAFLGTVALAERQLQRVTGSILRDVVVGIDVEPVIVFVREDECTEGSIYIELRLYIKIELAVRFDDLITEREISHGEMSRRGDLFTAQMIQQFAPLIIARRELRPGGMVHRR